MTKVLVANRGEIAVRIISTLRKMGVPSLAVYSEADAYAPHVHLADEAACIGPAPARQSYLDGERLLAVAIAAGADAIHPGYGFLSEDAAFARACTIAGLAWIGPAPEHIEQFGRKDAARELAARAGVPLLRGSGVLHDADDARRAAAAIGYPVMCKSRAGGGGIGMRRCDTPGDIDDAFAFVTRAGEAHFGDGACFVEQFIETARHVEVQVFGDGEGEVVALGLRDCSMQRRNQKIIEETPPPSLDARTCEEMTAAAVELARSVAYRSAGTVEFVLDAVTHEFAFLEMNTRLQVEHPVTEAVTGIDLVEWMVRLADGSLPPLDELRARTQPRGVAIEARVYAEDPLHDFRPSSGVLTEWHVPAGARVDTWVSTGTEITPHYDPLLAKVVVHGANRNEALDRMRDVLAQARVSGVETNLRLLRAIVADADFAAGNVSTASVAGVALDDRAIEVVVAGAQTTVQEWPGRLGAWAVGVPPSGPMDDVAFRVANLLVGNAPGTPALECTMVGPSLRFTSAATIALTGASMDADVDGAPVRWATAFEVAAGATLRLGVAAGPGARAYLAVRGGLVVAEYLGSRATFVLGRFGGHAGRALVAGDVLHVGDGQPHEPFAADSVIEEYRTDWQLRVLPGPHAEPDFFTAEDIETLHTARWRVHHQSDRTGVRLIGPAPVWARVDGGEAGLHPSNIHDNAYAIGAIDFTGDMPVILGPDGPSLGGFVCPATVATVDAWKLGQLRAGDTVQFVPVTHELAVELLDRREERLRNPATSARRRPRSRATSAILHAENTRDDRPSLTIRRAGDRHVLVEIGEPRLDFEVRVRVHLLHQALAGAFGDAVELTPGIRSLLARFDPRTLDLDTLLERIVVLDRRIATDDHVVVPSRIVRLPLAWNDSQTQLAIERYAHSVRADAPWCPSNLEFIRRINGLDTVDDVRGIVFDASYLVLGLGDVYLGAPVATPIDPRHRLVTTKYNPARTWTPENAVGIGGAYLCVYGMESPGGYQLVGRTVQMWSRFRTPVGFAPGRPWLLEFFDQLQFFPVSEEELLSRRADIEHGRGGVDIEPATFDLGSHRVFLAEHAREIAAFRERREQAFADERARWRASGVQERMDAIVDSGDGDTADSVPPGCVAIAAPVPGSFARVFVAPGDAIRKGDTVAVLEAMKTEVPVAAPAAGVVAEIRGEPGALVRAGQTLLVVKS